MALEDLAEFRAINGSTVYPSDGNQTAKLVRAMGDLDGISFLRTTRADTPVIYEADEDFPVGGSKTVRSTDDDDVTIVAAGITLHEALAAADRLADEDIAARVIDLYSVKPIDAETIRAIRTPIVTAEDHWAEGGLGEAVLAAFADADDRPPVQILAVRELPSGKPAELSRCGDRRRGDHRRRTGHWSGPAFPPDQSGSRSIRTVIRSVPISRTTRALRAGSERCRSRGSSSGSAWAVPVRQRPPTKTRTRGSAAMFRT